LARKKKRKGRASFLFSRARGGESALPLLLAGKKGGPEKACSPAGRGGKGEKRKLRVTPQDCGEEENRTRPAAMTRERGGKGRTAAERKRGGGLDTPSSYHTEEKGKGNLARSPIEKGKD